MFVDQHHEMLGWNERIWRSDLERYYHDYSNELIYSLHHDNDRETYREENRW